MASAQWPPQGGSGSGATSVGLALPSSTFTVSGSPVTTTGTLTGTFKTQTANTVLAGPTTGSAAVPAFRALVAADIPSLSYATTTLNNLGTTAINADLTFQNAAHQLAMPTDGTNTAANALTLRGQDKTGFDQSGGDVTIRPGGATGAVSSAPGVFNIDIGGGAYSVVRTSIGYNGTMNFPATGSIQWPNGARILQGSGSLNFNYGGALVWDYGADFMELGIDLVFPNDVRADNKIGSIGVATTGAFNRVAFPPVEVHIQNGMVFGEANFAGSSPVPALGELMTVSGSSNNLTLSPQKGDTTGKVIINGSVANAANQTTLSGSAGSAVCAQPEQGTSYKKVLCFLSGYTTASQAYTFPTAFTNTPFVYGDTTVTAVAVATTTTVTFTSATLISGWIFIEGY